MSMITDDAGLARSCADLTGRALVAERTRPALDVGKRGDALAHRLLVDALRTARPRDMVLSEEAADDRARLHASRVWIVDPLDGTREYGDPGRPEWAVHVALWDRDHERDGGLAAGAVALPARGLTLGTDRPPVVPASDPRRLRIAVSRSRPPAVATRLAGAVDAELVPLGSAGYKVAAVLLGEVDAYVHAGGQYQWDSAGPVAVAHSAGMHASRIDGAALRYNTSDLSVPDLLVCRPELAAMLLDEIALAAVRCQAPGQTRFRE